ncbi:MAG: adenylate kinase [Planctomycetota bacterium]
MSQTFVLFGPPGCGKGTQAARLKDALGVPHISTGEMFRDHIARKTELGEQVEAILAGGNLVPDSVTDAMVRERLGRADVKQGALLDGYPRNVAQAKELCAILESYGRELDGVIAIDVPSDELVERITKRARGPDDRDPKTIQNRLEVYRQQSEPCIEHYAGTEIPVHHIDGVGTMDEVTERILAALK